MEPIFLTALLCTTMLLSHAAIGDEKRAEEKEPEVDGRKLSEWERLLKSGDTGDRQAAILALGKIGPKGVPALAEGLKDKEIVNVRLWAAWGLRRNGADAKAAIPQLVQALKDECGLVQIEAAKTLWEISEHKATVPALIELLKHKDPNIREGAAKALGSIGPKAKAAVPALEKALKDMGRAEEVKPDGSLEFRTVNIAARKALEKIDPEAVKKAGID